MVQEVTELVAKYAETRRKLKDEKNYAALAKLPRNSSPTRSASAASPTGRRRGYYRKFKIPRIKEVCSLPTRV